MILIIKTQHDLDRHFEIHKESRDKYSELRIKALEKNDNDEYDRLCKEEEKLKMDDYGFVVSDKIHANSCCGGCYAISNIHYCPYCGVEFIPQVSEDT